eukprot:481338-Rhodomonas_salina.2
MLNLLGEGREGATKAGNGWMNGWMDSGTDGFGRWLHTEISPNTTGSATSPCSCFRCGAAALPGCRCLCAPPPCHQIYIQPTPPCGSVGGAAITESDEGQAVS